MTMSYFQFEININVLVSSFRFVLIPTLSVYGHQKYFTLSMRGSTLHVAYIVGPRAERVNTLIYIDYCHSVFFIGTCVFNRLYNSKCFI